MQENFWAVKKSKMFERQTKVTRKVKTRHFCHGIQQHYINIFVVLNKKKKRPNSSKELRHCTNIVSFDLFWSGLLIYLSTFRTLGDIFVI